ncbi:hypothetical protein [Burkholderia guangdongensis]|uniref:hypothetical protein n=1 Tax=Burkholderia guangdongensis TaxID=1792500 RepID=UPI0015C8C63D|nr:hypothetical protein [Burkholderia guangdongensis]
MKNYLENVPRIFIIAIIFTGIQSIAQKHFSSNIDIPIKIMLAIAAVLLEIVLCRYFKSDYGCTSWTFCHRDRLVARASAARTNKLEDNTLLDKIKRSGSLKNSISFIMTLFFTIITIIGVSVSIGKILNTSIFGNTTVGLISIVIAIPLASLFFRYYQFTGKRP